MNLLDETKRAISESGHVPADIAFIGSEFSGHQCLWPEFYPLANFEYNAGFGDQHIAHDLIIVFSDGAKMWRHEYDGSESWVFSSPFVIPKERHVIRSLGSNNTMWSSLNEINATNEEEIS